MRRSERLRAAKNKGNANDFISRMPDDILIMILSLMPIKDAVVTSSLSTKWRFMWYNLILLNFDGSETLDKIVNDQKLRESEQKKYIKQMYGAIKSYNRPKVHGYRIRFDLDRDDKSHIDEWLQFAVNKKVEILDMDLVYTGHEVCEHFINYDFPYRLSDRDISHLFEWPKANTAVVEMQFLRKLYLKRVNVSEEILRELLMYSTNLETISIHDSGYLECIHVGGQTLNLKHFEIVNCAEVESIYLYDFELISFTYKGQALELRLTNLPKIEQLDIGQGLAGFDNKVFSQISSCASSLQILSLMINCPEESFKLDFIPELPNVKKLSLTIGAHEDNRLLEFASITNSCPNLEAFTIELLWVSPMKMRKVRHAATNHPHEHLKLFRILGYYGRISDLELVAYVIENAVALKKIVVDTRFQAQKGIATAKDFLESQHGDGSSIKHELVSILPQGVELVIL